MNAVAIVAIVAMLFAVLVCSPRNQAFVVEPQAEVVLQISPPPIFPPLPDRNPKR